MPESSPALRVIDGDAGASFRQLYAEHQAFVWRTVQHLGLPAAHADDATQEVFIVVHRRLADYDGSRSVRAWLWGICRLVVANFNRAENRHRRRLAVVEHPATGEDLERELARDEALGFVREFVAKLSPKLRDVFVLVEIEGMSGPEAADALRVRVNTLYSRLRKSRALFDVALSRREAITKRETGDER